MKTFLRSLLRVLIGFAILFAVIALLFGIYAGTRWYFAPSIESRQLVEQNPKLSNLPQSLVDESVAPLTGQPVNVLGLSIRFPWELMEQRPSLGIFASLKFTGGANVLIFGPGFTSDVTKLVNQKSSHARSTFSAQELSSNYAFVTAEVHTLPGDVKWWALRKRNNRAYKLLFAKNADMLLGTTIYRVNFGQMRGYQFGDPRKDGSVQLELFDQNDRHYKLSILNGASTKGEQSLTQAEINAIIASMRPLP